MAYSRPRRDNPLSSHLPIARPPPPNSLHIHTTTAGARCQYAVGGSLAVRSLGRGDPRNENPGGGMLSMRSVGGLVRHFGAPARRAASEDARSTPPPASPTCACGLVQATRRLRPWKTVLRKVDLGEVSAGRRGRASSQGAAEKKPPAWRREVLASKRRGRSPTVNHPQQLSACTRNLLGESVRNSQ